MDKIISAEEARPKPLLRRAAKMAVTGHSLPEP